MTVPTDPTASAPPPLTPGVRTSEFWTMLVVSVLALLAGFNLIGPDWAKHHEQVVNALAFLASAVAPGLYALARGLAKRGHQQAVATVLAAHIAAQRTAPAPRRG